MRDGAIDLRTVVVQKKEPVAVDVEGSVVMMSLAQGKYYGLDDIGTRIWELVAEPRSIQDVCDRLVDEFEVDRRDCERDVIEFVGQLAAENLVDLRNGPPA